MKESSKKLLALLLCAAMLFALLPAFAAAEDGKNDEPAVELPEIESTEPAEEEPTEEPADAEPVSDEPEGDGPVTVSDEPLVVGTNSFWFYTPGETVYRPFTPEEDAFYQIGVRYHRLILADSELNEIARLEPPDTSYTRDFRIILSAGETYYFGLQYLDSTSTGYCNTTLQQFSLDSCGNSMTWEFDEETGTLFFHGEGMMWSYAGPDAYPWAVYRDQVRKVDFTDVDRLEMVAPYAFYRFENLTETAFAWNQTPKIGNYAFCGTGITSINMNSGANYIGKYAFADCKNLTSFSLSVGVGYTVTVSEYAFYNSGLKTMRFLDNSTYNIMPYAFANCYDFETLNGGNGETTIGEHAFENSGIRTVTGMTKLKTIGAYAFANCENLIRVPGTDDLLEISEFAFYNSGVQRFHVGKKLAAIGKGAFAGCTKLTTEGLTAEPENERFTAKDGMLLSKDQRTLYLCIPYLLSDSFDVPFGIMTIAGGAFYGAENLTGVSMNPGMTVIETGAFDNCPALNSVTFVPSVKVIQSAAFTDCPALSDVYYQGTEAERNSKLTVEAGNDALLSAEWHYQEPCNFDGTVQWNTEDVQMKGTTPYVVWNGDAFTPRFTLKTAAGEAVDPATYTVAYQANADPGTGYVFVTFTEGYTGTMRLFFKIYLPATTSTTVENIQNGIRISWAPVEGAAGYVIYRRAWNLVDAGWTTFERWNNTTATTWTDTTVYAGTRYQYGVKAYFDRRMDAVTGAEIGGNVGDNFNLGMVGPLKTTVRITTRHLNDLQAGSGSITANWDASKVFTGYQVKYATDEAFTKNVKSVKIGDPKTQSTVLRSLTNGTPYYVCVRSYHEFEGMTYFGQWSNVIRIKPGSGQTVYDVMYRALLIGENNYSGDLALKGPVNDMNAMSGMLKGLNRPFEVKTLPNSKKAAILNAIKTTYADAMDNDVSLFYYSGHGADAGGNDTYQGALVPIDENLITMQELAAELSKVRGRVIVILDSCLSGAAIEPKSTQDGNGPDPMDEVSEAFFESAVEAFSGYYLETEGSAPVSGTRMGEFRQSKFIVITAATAYASSYEGKFDGSGYSQGAFTAALIKGLGCRYADGAYTGSMPADTNKNKQVTLYEIYDYAYNQAYNWTRQRAKYYGPNDEVLFRR